MTPLTAPDAPTIGMALAGPATMCAAAAAGIVVLLAHSVVDYSLRTSSLAITFALLMGLLMPLPATGARRPERMPRQ